MSNIIQLTLLGLNKKYYIRNFLIGLIFGLFLLFVTEYIPSQSTVTIDESYMLANRIVQFFIVISIFLYPYAKYLYDKIWSFFANDGEWLVGGILLIFVYYFKLMARILLFSSAILLAPIGLIVLYFDNR